MRKKIEITTDEWRDADPTPATDEVVPEFADHLNHPADHVSKDEEAEADCVAADAVTVPPTLEAQLEDAVRSAKEAENQLAYLQAEFQNFRRRKDEETRELAKFTNRELIKALLPIVDNFERALRAAEQTRNIDSIVSGISGTLKQLQAFLQKSGVTPIEAVGKEFDPNFHEAIGHAESDDYPANTVSEEVQRGYLMHDRVLRPTLVKVSE